MLSLRYKRYTFARNFFSYHSLQVQLGFRLQTLQFLLIVEGCF